MEWIFPCNAKYFSIHQAFNEINVLDWASSNYKVNVNDIVYIYVGAPESAVKYKCVVTEINKQKSTIDDSKYGGNPSGTIGKWMELKLLFKFPEPGVTLSDLRMYGIKPTNSMQGANKVPEDLSQLFSYWEIDAFPKKEKTEDKNLIELGEVDRQVLKGYERDAIVKARVNQSVFRKQLVEKYKKCCLCGINHKDLLIASHIKPWIESTASEKTDIDNGLLLCPNHDKLFDSGYISFDEKGHILISSELNSYNMQLLNINSNMTIDMMDGQKIYMKYHRDMVFRK